MAEQPVDYSRFDEPDPEELQAKAGKLFALVLSQVDLDILKPHLHEFLFIDLMRAIELCERAEKRLANMCDGRTAWGVHEGIGIGRNMALQELKERAEAEGRADILEWLTSDRRPRMKLKPE